MLQGQQKLYFDEPLKMNSYRTAENPVCQSDSSLRIKRKREGETEWGGKGEGGNGVMEEGGNQILS